MPLERRYQPEVGGRLAYSCTHPSLCHTSEGLRTIINGQEDLRVVGEASDGSLAMACVRECQPDVILMDINMPTLNGVETTRRIKAELPGIAVIGLSVHEDDRMALNMRDAGASAYLSKGGSFEALCDTIRQTIERQGCG